MIFIFGEAELHYLQKRLGGFFTKYKHLFINSYKNDPEKDEDLFTGIKNAYKALKDAYTGFNIKKCSRNSVISLIKTLGTLLLLTNNKRSASGQEIPNKKVYNEIFFTNDPSVMRKLNNLESIQKKYIDILQNLYNLYIPIKMQSLKLRKELYHYVIGINHINIITAIKKTL